MASKRTKWLRNQQRKHQKIYETTFDSTLTQYFTEACIDDVKEIEALIANPDIEFAIRNYGSVQNYRAMLREKLKKYMDQLEKCDEDQP